MNWKAFPASLEYFNLVEDLTGLSTKKPLAFNFPRRMKSRHKNTDWHQSKLNGCSSIYLLCQSLNQFSGDQFCGLYVRASPVELEYQHQFCPFNDVFFAITIFLCMARKNVNSIIQQ
jgi:hypothetical protein